MNNLLNEITAKRDDNLKKSFPKTKFFFVFISELIVFATAFFLSLVVVGEYFSPVDEEMMKMIKSFDSADYVVVAIGMLAYLMIQKERNYYVSLAALFCLCLAVSTQLITLIPADIEIGDVFGRQTFIYLPIAFMFASFFGITFNLIIIIFKSVEDA
ncbi:hypothetical protein [Vreelandella piezotolerans]|uniref:hypothetical protein n=1 Tax=Vreelandella piezotolerans TaxID=2609667 RepID=UPI003799BE69